ncbi:GTP-binding protein, putative [Plasmodium knowlesi strain H]|uniref:GTP-binding protein, putative n=3 Tax=Plasmodium knowlesi TaxID=5850 RepID=A0A5K1UGU5_PLAKH|nr:GTP-binding protein Obg2, putative [Plasmodium knowlesi strain H]OTN68058.1 putative GTP-binding protein [Plasmodium knowlesi]CAA9990221.1 GTP-binding protein Obg2, putative [Plasmodium knowlesi strain H]SBO26840.1 GTP-binding protein, putative [Plasmodium knowlesi strain H]SBO28455.1 GTP-binding protein, putative [Plasmodium knowlesi strain H]VVS79695.1 GTP-binding protein Obg2, putative [Plasmodium knowlesi strain H]|eukprot:XP_002258080.1 gtp-binding protein, putative [Plasmodium knowlesi strain H]
MLIRKLSFLRFPQTEIVLFLLKHEGVSTVSLGGKSKGAIRFCTPRSTTFSSLCSAGMGNRPLGGDALSSIEQAAQGMNEESSAAPGKCTPTHCDEGKVRSNHHNLNGDVQEKDDVYENSECVYIKGDRKFVVRRRRGATCTGGSSDGDAVGMSVYRGVQPGWDQNEEVLTKGEPMIIPQLSKEHEAEDSNLSFSEGGMIWSSPSKGGSRFITNAESESPGKNCAHQSDEGAPWDAPKNEALMKILTEPTDHLMMRNERRFCDFLWVVAKSGKGGEPNYKRRRSKKLKGEGYGGHGGNVILKSKKSIYDLIKIEQKVKANDGENFKENSRGKDGSDKIVFVPVGTIVRKRIYCKKKNENNRKMYKSIFWHQFLKENEELLVARGGKGGISYSFFKKHDYRLPENGEKMLLELELRLMNDVAFIGIGNSGKTSLCSSLSRYYGNISSQIFSTTIPHVSNINYIDGVEITLLDTPFLFYNAHKDSSRGKRILRHLYRSKLIVYVIDVASDKLENVDDTQVEDYYTESLKRANSKASDGGKTIDAVEAGEEEVLKESTHKDNCTDERSNHMHASKEVRANLKDYHNDTIKQIKMLRNELFLFNPDYLKKKELVVATKCDMLHKNALLNLDSLYFRLKNIFPHIEVIGTSAKFGLGIKLLSRKIRELIYPEHVLMSNKMYAKNIEDYIIPTQSHAKEGQRRLQNYELPENVKHIYDHNYMENFDYFLKKPRGKKHDVGVSDSEDGKNLLTSGGAVGDTT